MWGNNQLGIIVLWVLLRIKLVQFTESQRCISPNVFGTDILVDTTPKSSFSYTKKPPKSSRISQEAIKKVAYKVQTVEDGLDPENQGEFTKTPFVEKE